VTAAAVAGRPVVARIALLALNNPSTVGSIDDS